MCHQFKETIKHRLYSTGVSHFNRLLEHFNESEEFVEWYDPSFQRKLGARLVQELRGKEISNKRNKTLFERYGTSNLQRALVLSEKRKSTNLKKYGGNSPFASLSVRVKSIKTCEERYGGNPMHCSEEVRDKLRRTNNKLF